MKHKLLQVCARTLRPVLPLVILAAKKSACLGAIIASSNFNSASSADAIPAQTWTPTVYLGPGAQTDSYANISAVGTVDVSTNTGSTSAPPTGTRTNALKTNINFTGASGSWTGGMQTPILTVSNGVTDLKQLNLSFDMLTNRTLPVRIKIESFDVGSNAATGGIQGEVIPPLYNSYYRYSVDLSTMAATGTGTFNPAAARVRFTFLVDGGTGMTAGWPNTTNNIVEVDNLCYTSPSLWVSNTTTTNTGADSSHPTTIADAFSRVQPGGVICFLGGTYASFPNVTLTGAPARWITLRAAPNQTPVINTAQRTNIEIIGGTAYVDIRGFTVQGRYAESDATAAANQVSAAQADSLKLNNSATPNDPAGNIYSGTGANIYYGATANETSGIVLDGRFANGSGVFGVHHIRLADNIVKDIPALGMGGNQGDYLYFENNTVTECAHLSRFAQSGFSIIVPRNFDGNTDTKIFVVRNTSGNNRGDIRWVQNTFTDDGYRLVDIRFSDGNGFIIDVNRNVDFDSSNTLAAFTGRTLVQNNVSYYNGGSGAHAFGAAKVDINNNTFFYNNQANKATGTVYHETYTANTKDANPTSYTHKVLTNEGNRANTSLGYAAVFAGSKTMDVHITNNIAYAFSGAPITSASPGASQNITIDYNVFGRHNDSTVNGGVVNSGNTSFSNNLANGYPDPLDIFASVTVGQSNFLRLKSGSPAVNHATHNGNPAAPTDDRDGGTMRPIGAGYDDGAYENF